VVETIPYNQALIYRLSGDYHPQHIDWEYAAANNEPRPILHAISYSGVVMRHFISTFIPDEPERLTRFKTRITAPVHPGSTLTTKLWKVGDGEARFMLVDANNPDAKPHLNWGIIEWV
jgi:acyl dehydratase